MFRYWRFGTVSWGKNYIDKRYDDVTKVEHSLLGQWLGLYGDKEYNETYTIELDFVNPMPLIFVRFDCDNKMYYLKVTGTLYYKENEMKYIVGYTNETINAITYEKYGIEKDNKDNNVYIMSFCDKPKTCEQEFSGALSPTQKLYFDFTLHDMTQNCNPDKVRVQIWGPCYDIISYSNGRINL